MRCGRRLAFCVAFLAGCAANGPSPEPRQPAQPPGLTACRQLVAAKPAAWPDPWRKVRAIGERAAPSVIRALRENPEGDGVQAAIHLLGVFGGDAARTLLESKLDDGTDTATEAALALGRIGDESSMAKLTGVVQNRAARATTRTAAAAALVDLGRGKDVASFLRAVFLAATPYAAESTRKHGLPRRKTRWAHERYMILEALRRRYDGRTFGLDEDASWPALRKGAAAMTKFLRDQ